MPLLFAADGSSYLSASPSITGPASTGAWSMMWWWKRTGNPAVSGTIYSRPTTVLTGKTIFLITATNKLTLSMAYAVGTRTKDVDCTETNVWCCDCFSINSSDPTNSLPTWYRRNSATSQSLSALSVTESGAGTGSETSPGTNDFVLGGDGTLGWVGQLAHVQIWNRILTLGEFVQAMHSPGSISNGLSGYWPMWFLGECINQSQYNCLPNNVSADKSSAPPVGRYYSKLLPRTGSREGGTTYSAMSCASLTSGVAPLGVFFDVVGATGVQYPPIVNDRHIWEEFLYEWDFGDPGSGSWSTNSRSKNKAYGYTAAHVYETPGTYTITLIITTNTGDTLRYRQTITITDPETVYAGNTFYVADDGDDGDAGSELEPWQTFSKAIAEMFASNGPRRILFKRGDTFTFSTYTTPSSLTGPFHFGAYGSGAKPIITSSTGGAVFQIDQTCTDTRFVDLSINSSAESGQAHRSGNQSLMLRNDIDGFDTGYSTSDAHGNKRYVFIVDCTFTNDTRYNIFFDHGQNVAIMGNSFGTIIGPDGPSVAGGEHMVRTYVTHSVISNNIFDGGFTAKHQLKFVGFFPTGNPLRVEDLATEAVEFGVISFNSFINPTTGLDWMVVLGPTDEGKDERLENCIVEGNYFESDDQNQVMLMLNNRWIVARNNIFDGSQTTTSLSGIRVVARGEEPDPDRHFIGNNSFYTSSTGNFRCIQIASGSTNILCINNLGSAPNSGSPAMILDAGTGTVQTTNLLTNTPGYTNAAGGDFTLTGSSVAINAGTVTSLVKNDYLVVRRPIGSTHDQGAYEYNP